MRREKTLLNILNERLLKNRRTVEYVCRRLLIRAVVLAFVIIIIVVVVVVVVVALCAGGCVFGAVRAAGFVFIFFKIFAVFFSRTGTRVVFGGIRGETVRFVVLFFFGSGVLHGLFETQIGNVVIAVGDVAGVIGTAVAAGCFMAIFGI